MSARCLSCHAPVPDGTEICGSCRTALVPRLDTQLLSADETGPHYTLSEEDLLHGEPTDTEVPFCGRKEELGRLLGCIEQSIKSHSLRSFLLLGATGQGKTRLLAELGRAATAYFAVSPDRVLLATVPGEGAAPLAIFIELIRRRCDLRQSEEIGAARDKLLRLCRVLLPAVRATEVAHVLGELLGIPFPDGSSQASGLAGLGVRTESRMYSAIKRFFVADARRGPLLILLDDMDEASPETVNLVNYLLDGLSDLPVVIGLSARPEFVEAFPDFGATSTPPLRLQLLHLSREDKLHLIASIVGAEPEELPAWVVSLCEQFSESTPRAMVELLRLLVETQVLSWQPGVGERSLVPVWDEERRSQLALPSSLPGVVEARLLAMAEGSRRLLEYAAVAGENFHLGALLTLSRCEASGLTSTEPADSDGPSLTEVQDGDSERLAELSELIEQLIGQGVLMAVPTSQLNVERELRFAYPPWQKTIYEQVESERKRRYHLLLAQFLQLQPDSEREDLQLRIARHCERASEGLLAAQAYQRAAELSVTHGAPGRAPRLLLRGLACLSSEHLSARLRLWQQLGRVLSLLGDFESALSAWEKVVRLSFVLASRRERAQAFLEMGRIVAHDPARALGFIERARSLFQQLQDQVGIADTLDEEGQALVWLGKLSDGMDRLAQALEMRRRLLDRKKVALSLLHVGQVEYLRGALDAAVSCYDEALRKHEDDVLLQAAAMTAHGRVDLARGDVAAARARFEEALPLCERAVASKEQVTLLCSLGDALLRDGLLSEAESRLIQARDLAQRLLDHRGMAESKRLLGLIQLRRGDKQKALEQCQRALERAQQSGLRSLIAQSLMSLGEIHAATLFDETVEGEHPAWDYLKRAVALLREGGDQIELAQGLAAFGKLLVERRKLGPGRAALREASQLAGRLRMKLHADLAPLLSDLGG